MIALSKSHILLLAAAVIVAGGTIAVVMQQRRAAPPAASPSVAQPAPTQRDATSPALAAVQAETKSIVAALGAPPPPEAKDGVPTFDIARIETSGDAVIAGRAAPGASVELLRNGEVHDRAVANAEGQFAMVPPRLPAGNYDLTLRADKAADGKPATSKQSVAVALAPNTNDRPVVALMTPDKPTVVLSQPGAAKNAGAIVVEAVEVQGTGKLHVSGRARPGASARFYLNDSFVAAATAGADGRFAITINEGVAPGNYRVRLDEVEGAIRRRARARRGAVHGAGCVGGRGRARRKGHDGGRRCKTAAAGCCDHRTFTRAGRTSCDRGCRHQIATAGCCDSSCTCASRKTRTRLPLQNRSRRLLPSSLLHPAGRKARIDAAAAS